MPFGNIVVGAKTFEPRNPGTYVLSTTTLGGPTEEIRIRPGSKTKNGDVTLNLTYIKDTDTGTAPDTIRDRTVVNVSITTSASGRVAPSVLDGGLDILDTFATDSVLTRIIQGEA